MKQPRLSFLNFLLYFIFTLALWSCASRPVPVAKSEAPPPVRVERPAPPPQIVPPEEPSDPFDRAMLLVKNNSPLIHKYFQLNSGAVEVKGKCQTGGKDFAISYNLAGAGFTGEQHQIAFSVEDTGSGAFRSGELFWTPGEDDAGLLLSFDDYFWPVWRQYFDLFENFDARITFFVQSSPPLDGALPAGSSQPNGSVDLSDKGLAAFCAEALDRGHSIGYHTINHPDLRKVSREVFDSETTIAAEGFYNAGIPFSAFAFPFGFSQEWMHEILLPVFKTTRGYGANYRLYNLTDIGGRHIVSKAIDNIMYPDDEIFKREIRLLLLAAKFIGGAAPFTTHDIADNVQWGIKPWRLEYLLQTTRELKLKFYTFDDFNN